MRIESTNQGVTPLRLVQGAQSAAAVDPVAPARTTPRVDGDTFSFEAMYVQNLPRVPLTDAHHRLERIRQQLVGATTDVPIHFSGSPSRPANPYAAGYLKLAPEPGEYNTNLTQARAAGE